jgi:Ca2+-binding EF-hand superfamily protein
MLYQQPSSSTGQNSPSATPDSSATTTTPPTLAPANPGQQFAADTLAALLNVQQQTPAERLIGQADTNGDGQLSQDEIAQSLQAGGQSVDNNALATQIAKIDTNGDGSLSADELTAALQQLDQGHHHHHHGGGHMGVSSTDLAGKIIGAGDTDGDGSLSQAELSGELGKMGVSMSSSDFATAFGKLDSNGDGMLSGAELAAAIDALRGAPAQNDALTAGGGDTTNPATSSTVA